MIGSYVYSSDWSTLEVPYKTVMTKLDDTSWCVIRANTLTLGVFFLCLFVGPFNPFLQTPHLSLTGCRVVFGMIIFVFLLVCLVGSSALPNLAGGSPPTPSPNWIIGAIPDQSLTRKRFATI